MNLDADRLHVEHGGNTMRLTPQQFAILELLFAVPGRLIRHQAIHAHLWGLDPNGGPELAANAVRVHVHRLRRALIALRAPACINSVCRVGYRLDFTAQNMPEKIFSRANG